MTVNVDADLERILTLLRAEMKRRGFTQVDVQNALGWKGSYISQLFLKHKELRVRQLLQILAVIGHDPVTFMCDAFEQSQPEIDPSAPHEALRHLKDGLQATSLFIEHLIGEGGDDDGEC